MLFKKHLVYDYGSRRKDKRLLLLRSRKKFVKLCFINNIAHKKNAHKNFRAQKENIDYKNVLIEKW